MAKSPSSKYASNRALTCSVPAEIIDNLGFPYGAVFTMTGKLQRWGGRSGEHWFNVWNPSTWEGHARYIILSRYPVYLETVSGTETASVVEGDIVVQKDFHYLDYYPCTFVDRGVPDPTNGNVTYYTHGFNEYVRGKCNFRYTRVDSDTGEVYYDYTEEISTDYPFGMGDIQQVYSNTTPYDRVIERNDNGLKFHEVYDGVSITTDAVEYKQAWNDWRNYSELGLNKSSFKCTWQYSSGSSQYHGLATDDMSDMVWMYNGTVYEPSDYNYGEYSPYCVSVDSSYFSTRETFKTVNRHSSSGASYNFKSREYTCKVALSGNTPSFGSRQAWIEYCKTLYD